MEGGKDTAAGVGRPRLQSASAAQGLGGLRQVAGLLFQSLSFLICKMGPQGLSCLYMDPLWVYGCL